uniref:G-protein coupled receptors family 1 profile domain-containing protein n=1 Tax=Callorhinchus milii TaxID=7868 RepID=A0A4W3GYB8_CALMI
IGQSECNLSLFFSTIIHHLAFKSSFSFSPTVNLVSAVILSRGNCGLSRCISRYLVAMATADLLVVITDAILTRINFLYFPVCFLDLTPVCSLGSVLLCAAGDASVWLTVVFTFDRSVAICIQKLRSCYCTDRTAYFIYKPFAIINKIPWGCEARLSFHTAPTWAAFDLIHTILTPFTPFFLIFLLNTLTVRCIVRASMIRRRLRGDRGIQEHRDSKMENRRKSIILLFTISGSFIAMWVTYVGVFLYRRIINSFTYSGYQDPLFVAERLSYMSQLCSCCTNTCIYAVTQSRFRQQLNNLMSPTYSSHKQRDPGSIHSCVRTKP